MIDPAPKTNAPFVREHSNIAKISIGTTGQSIHQKMDSIARFAFSLILVRTTFDDIYARSTDRAVRPGHDYLATTALFASSRVPPESTRQEGSLLRLPEWMGVVSWNFGKRKDLVGKIAHCWHANTAETHDRYKLMCPVVALFLLVKVIVHIYCSVSGTNIQTGGEGSATGSSRLEACSGGFGRFGSKHESWNSALSVLPCGRMSIVNLIFGYCLLEPIVASSSLARRVFIWSSDALKLWETRYRKSRSRFGGDAALYLSLSLSFFFFSVFSLVLITDHHARLNK